MGKKCTYIKLTDDDTILNRVRLMASEFLGTFILVFLGCMSCTESLMPEPVLTETIALGFGIAVCVSVTCVGHISGSHINPAISLGAVMLGYMPLINMPLYWIAQILGSIVAYGSLMLLSGGMQPNATQAAFCVNHISKDLNEAQGFVVEMFCTMILMLSACGVWDYRNRERHDSVPIKFGLIVAGIAIAAIPFTSASLNPARSIGPALLALDFHELWLFIAGPLCGGFIGAVLYRTLFEYKHAGDME